MRGDPTAANLDPQGHKLVPPIRRISLADRTLLLIGSIGPLGHLPASGTATVALLGAPLFWALSSLTAFWQASILLLFTTASMWIHHYGDRILGEHDSRKLVWDELAGFMVAIFMLPFTWQLAVCAILLERVLDILKPPPANWIDRKWRSGVGAVADDLVAGIYTSVLLHLAMRFVPTWLGLTAD